MYLAYYFKLWLVSKLSKFVRLISYIFPVEKLKERERQKIRKKEEVGSLFQRQRVDVLLEELANKFPPKQAVNLALDKTSTGV